MLKITKFIALVCVLVATLLGCSKGNPSSQAEISIVTTIFPIYDWTKQILGDEIQNVQLTLLQDSGADLHNYQPTAQDIITITQSDMFIYLGGHSDTWVKGVLEQAQNQDMVVINLIELLGDKVKEEVLVEGMEHNHPDHEFHTHHEKNHENHVPHNDEHHHEHHHQVIHPLDEHIWLSLTHAEFCVYHIIQGLCKVDGKNERDYRTNGSQYLSELRSLDQEYRDLVASSPTKTLLFADRFPFRYMMDDYGINYYAAFSGCSAESEASFETIAFLTEKVQRLKLSVILTIENPNHQIAQTIVRNTAEKNQEILSLNSMQSTTKEDIENGATYLSIMQENIKVLEQALWGGNK